MSQPTEDGTTGVSQPNNSNNFGFKIVDMLAVKCIPTVDKKISEVANTVT